jgi:hypothetical protein
MQLKTLLKKPIVQRREMSGNVNVTDGHPSTAEQKASFLPFFRQLDSRVAHMHTQILLVFLNALCMSFPMITIER